MRDSSWFRRLDVALGFDAGFEIFLLIGRGELARPALARVAEELGRAGAVKWHRLHLDGLDGLLADEQPEGLLHLVHGFERMPRDAAIDMAARLNVNRDRLEVLRGPVIFWIPADFYEELLRQAPDFVAWRSQASVVVEDDLELSDEVVAEQFVVCRTLVAAAPALARVPGFDVMVQGVRRPVLEWLREGTERSLRCSAQDGAPELLAWCAGMLARLHDADEREFVPLLLPASLLDLAQHIMGTASLCAQLVRCLLARDEFARALTMAEQGLQALDRDAENFGARMMLLDACAEACSKLGMDERALEYETQKFELRLEHSEQKWPVLAILANKLFRANALDRALDVTNQAIESQREQEDDLPLLGETGALHLLADIQRARGDRQATIAALREAIRVYRAVIEYQGPGWSQRFLALTLLDLAAELDSDAALVQLREAVELLEQVDHTPGQYPAALADALVQLGDHAAARRMHELAATAYARVLALASPFPARESEALASVERRLRAVCGTGGFAVDDALTRGQQPLAWPS